MTPSQYFLARFRLSHGVWLGDYKQQAGAEFSLLIFCPVKIVLASVLLHTVRVYYKYLNPAVHLYQHLLPVYVGAWWSENFRVSGFQAGFSRCFESDTTVNLVPVTLKPYLESPL